MLFVTNGKEGKRNWWTGKTTCDECESSIEPSGLHIRVWHRQRYEDIVLCVKCFEQQPTLLPSAPIQEKRIILPCDTPPSNSILITPRRPELRNGGLSVYDAADNKRVPSLNTIDKTLLAGRNNATFLDDNAPILIGKDIRETINGQDQVLSYDKALKLLDNIERGE